MSNAFLNVIVGLSATIIAFLAFADDIRKLKRYKIFKSSEFKIIVFLVATSAGIFATYIKDINSDRKIQDEKNESHIQKYKSDSIIFESQREIFNLQLKIKDTIIRKVDDAYQKSLYTSNEALAKYNLQITDSLNLVISNLKLEAIKTQLVMAVSEKGPPAYFVKKGNIDVLNLRIDARGGTCYNIDMYYYILSPDSNIILEENHIMYGTYVLAENVYTTYSIEINPSYFQYKRISIFLKGSFAIDPEGKRKVPFYRWLKINLEEKRFESFGSTDFENLIILNNEEYRKLLK